MKRTISAYIVIVGIGACIVVLPPHTHAALSTPSATPNVATDSASSHSLLDDLKARLATKVAELRTVVKRAMSGTVKTVSLTSATVETKTKDIKIELTDDVTVAQMIGGKRTSLELSDIDERDPITVFGTYDETLDLLKAHHIFIESSTPVTQVSGTVADVDTEEFQLVVNTREMRTVTVDFEKTTKTTSWTKDGGLVKGGFSKIQVGDTVHIVGKPNAKIAQRVSAVRILDLGNITGAAVSPTETPTPTESASPSATPKSKRGPTPFITP